eukprot:2034927-Rhodomonas_salina.1
MGDATMRCVLAAPTCDICTLRPPTRAGLNGLLKLCGDIPGPEDGDGVVLFECKGCKYGNLDGVGCPP